MSRDVQKSRLYAAEDAALNGHPPSPTSRRYLILDTLHPDGYRYASIASTQAYVDAVRTSAPFQRRWGHRSLKVYPNAGSSRGGGGLLHMSADHRRNEYVVLHEMAHNLSPRSGHGPEFAAVYLELVKVVMGAEAAAVLRSSYADRRVKYRPGLKVVPKPSAERLARARRVKVRRAQPGVEITPEQAAAKVARRREREQVPMTYEQSYESGWRSTYGDPTPRTMYRKGFSPDAFNDGYLDAAAGRAKFHRRDCTAHHNDEGGCGEA